jgi:hypothetical protein
MCIRKRRRILSLRALAVVAAVCGFGLVNVPAISAFSSSAVVMSFSSGGQLLRYGLGDGLLRSSCTPNPTSSAAAAYISAMTAAPGGNLWYAVQSNGVNQENARIYKMTPRCVPLGSIPVGGAPAATSSHAVAAIAMDPSGRFLWVDEPFDSNDNPNGNSYVYKLNPTTGQILQTCSYATDLFNLGPLAAVKDPALPGSGTYLLTEVVDDFEFYNTLQIQVTDAATCSNVAQSSTGLNNGATGPSGEFQIFENHLVTNRSGTGLVDLGAPFGQGTTTIFGQALAPFAVLEHGL